MCYKCLLMIGRKFSIIFRSQRIFQFCSHWIVNGIYRITYTYYFAKYYSTPNVKSDALDKCPVLPPNAGHAPDIYYGIINSIIFRVDWRRWYFTREISQLLYTYWTVCMCERMCYLKKIFWRNSTGLINKKKKVDRISYLQNI